MTEEMKENLEEKKCNCICQSQEFKKFLIVALGTFVGVFCALSLFAALHKPPRMIPCPRMMPPIQHVQHFDRGMRRPDVDFHKKFIKDRVNKEIPVRVDVERAER